VGSEVQVLLTHKLLSGAAASRHANKTLEMAGYGTCMSDTRCIVSVMLSVLRTIALNVFAKYEYRVFRVAFLFLSYFSQHGTLTQRQALCSSGSHNVRPVDQLTNAGIIAQRVMGQPDTGD
jgi:hypothetical protein